MDIPASSPSQVVVVADAHLGQVPAETRTAFHTFLDAVPDLGDALLINGDLFDFWFEWSRVIPRRHFPTVSRLERLRSKNVPITFVGGNHDRWGGEFLTEDLGIAFYAGAAHLKVAGREAFVAHGDGIAEQHWSAALLHRVTRYPLTIAAFRALHPSLGFWIADRLSGHLADDTRDPAVLERAARAQSAFAKTLLERHPELSLVIMAHTHRPTLETLPGGRAYLNPGAWMDGHRYAVVTRDAVELHQFGDQNNRGSANAERGTG